MVASSTGIANVQVQVNRHDELERKEAEQGEKDGSGGVEGWKQIMMPTRKDCAFGASDYLP